MSARGTAGCWSRPRSPPPPATPSRWSIPWHDWLATRRGRVLLDLWCGGLIAFVACSSSTAARTSRFCSSSLCRSSRSCRSAGVAASGSPSPPARARSSRPSVPLSAGATAMRLALVAAAVAVALVLVRAIRREAAAHERAAARADLERTLARGGESPHQERPADRRRSAAARPSRRPRRRGLRRDGRAHPLDRDRAPPADRDRRSCRRRAHSCASITAERAGAGDGRGGAGTFDAATAQKLGIVANELVTNAFQHGAPPIAGATQRGPQTRLVRRRQRRRHRACGRLRPRSRPADGRAGSRRTVRAARAADRGGTRAEVVFPTARR